MCIVLQTAKSSAVFFRTTTYKVEELTNILMTPRRSILREYDVSTPIVALTKGCDELVLFAPRLPATELPLTPHTSCRTPQDHQTAFPEDTLAEYCDKTQPKRLVDSAVDKLDAPALNATKDAVAFRNKTRTARWLT